MIDEPKVIGIFASPRATMYVDGSWHNVDIDEIPSLAKREQTLYL